MALCCERNVTISFLTENGRFLGRVEGATPGNVLVRREQFRRADDERASARIAAAVVAGKVANCRTVLLRALRDYADGDGRQRLASAAERLKGAFAGADSRHDARGSARYRGRLRAHLL